MPRSHAPSDLPSTPPPEALDAVAAAWERAQDLSRAGWELELTRGRMSRRLRGVVRDPRHHAVQRMRSWGVVRFACGELDADA